MIFPFYQIKRDMGLPIRKDDENDAEHSWSLALTACALAPVLDPTLDIGKVSQFAIVHDLVEVYAGDVSVYDIDEENHLRKDEREHRALQELAQHHPDLPWIANTITEYERKDTNEARYVWAMDKHLAMYMRYTYAQPFFERRGITKAHFDKSVERTLRKAHAHPAVGELFDDIVAKFDAHPEWFVQS